MTGGPQVQSIFSDVAASEYELSPDRETGAWQSPNRANGVRFVYHNTGFTVVPRHSSRLLETWAATFTLRSCGEGAVLADDGPSDVEVVKNTAKVTSGDVVFIYSNETGGLHQSFLVNRPPVAGQLRLDLEVSGQGVSLKQSPAGDGVNLTSATTGEELATYSGLKAFDARGNDLAARMLLDGTDHIMLAIDDSTAQYPVLVDPWFTSVTLNGPGQTGAEFGYNVFSYLMYTNARFYGVIAVGVPYYDYGGYTDCGAVVVYYQDSGGLHTTRDWYATGEASYAHLGYSVVGTRGPGFKGSYWGDIAAGEPGYSSGGGRVLVWYGASGGLGTLNRSADTTLAYSSSGEHFGDSLATGNVRNGSYEDLVVGAPTSGNASRGAAYLYLGSSTGLPTSSSQSWTGGYDSMNLGYSVSMGDVNGDGKADVVVGCPGYSSGYGMVYIYHGNSSGASTTADWSQYGPQSGAQFGYAVFANLNLDGDTSGSGYPIQDLLVGAPYYTSDSLTSRGAMFVYTGRTSGGPLYNSGASQYGEYASANFGAALSGGNIAEGTGEDAIVGAPGDRVTSAGDGKGKVWVYYGASPNPFSSNAPFDSGNSSISGENFGTSVSYVSQMQASGYNGFYKGFVAGGPHGDPTGFSNQGMAVMWLY